MNRCTSEPLISASTERRFSSLASQAEFVSNGTRLHGRHFRCPNLALSDPDGVLCSPQDAF